MNISKILILNLLSLNLDLNLSKLRLHSLKSFSQRLLLRILMIKHTQVSFAFSHCLTYVLIFLNSHLNCLILQSKWVLICFFSLIQQHCCSLLMSIEVLACFGDPLRHVLSNTLVHVKLDVILHVLVVERTEFGSFSFDIIVNP